MPKTIEDNFIYGNYYVCNSGPKEHYGMYCSFHKVKVVDKDNKPFCEKCNEFIQCLPEKEFEEKRKRCLSENNL